jgi:YHS domain-containing protein
MTRFALVLTLFAVAACQSKRTPVPAESSPEPERPTVTTTQASVAPPSAPSAGVLANGLTVVRDRNHVCMVNDQYMGREQIPVTVSDKTYYGCCPMCKGRLERDAAARQATDPVTGNSVDKASAVIARAPSGNVLYFESERTLAQYKL